MQNIICIHGAHSSSVVFNYITSKIEDVNYIFLSYNTNDGFYLNLEKMLSQLDSKKHYKCISHSMGGIYALHLSKFVHFRKSVSIATPFGGSSFADYARFMMPQYKLFKDVHTKSLPILQLQDIKIATPWLQIVTTGGHLPWIGQKNDGVVTIESMTCRKDVDYAYSEHGHHEVMLSDKTVSEIKKFIL
jgi:hypothetical protein